MWMMDSQRHKQRHKQLTVANLCSQIKLNLLHCRAYVARKELKIEMVKEPTAILLEYFFILFYFFGFATWIGYYNSVSQLLLTRVTYSTLSTFPEGGNRRKVPGEKYQEKSTRLKFLVGSSQQVFRRKLLQNFTYTFRYVHGNSKQNKTKDLKQNRVSKDTLI